MLVGCFATQDLAGCSYSVRRSNCSSSLLRGDVGIWCFHWLLVSSYLCASVESRCILSAYVSLKRGIFNDGLKFKRMKVDVSDCTERGCRRLRVDGKGVNFDAVNDPVSLISASQQPWRFSLHYSHQGLTSVLSQLKLC